MTSMHYIASESIVVKNRWYPSVVIVMPLYFIKKAVLTFCLDCFFCANAAVKKGYEYGRLYSRNIKLSAYASNIKPAIAAGCDPVPYRTRKSNLSTLLRY